MSAGAPRAVERIGAGLPLVLRRAVERAGVGAVVDVLELVESAELVGVIVALRRSAGGRRVQVYEA